MLTSLKNAFYVPAAAIAVGGITMLSPMTAHADDMNITASSSTSADVAMERLQIQARARNYAKINPGHIGVSVLKGIDAPASGAELATAIAGATETVSGRQVEGFSGDNGNKATEIAFHVPLIKPDGKVSIQSFGPYNMSDAADVLRQWDTKMAPAYTTISLD